MALSVAVILSVSVCASAQGKIAFDSCADGNCEIFIINPDGTGLVRLTFNAATDRDPALSLIDNNIAFISNRDGNSELYLMGIDGSNPTRLTNTTNTIESGPSLNADGSQIVYSEGVAGGGFSSKVCLINSDGSNYHCIAAPGTRNEEPSFTPDGRIVFASNRDQSNTREIYIMNGDGTNQTRLTTILSSVDSQPSCSYTGGLIFFTSTRDGNNEIYWMNLDGSNQTRVTNNTIDDHAASPSTNGYIAWAGRLTSSDLEIYVMNYSGIGFVVPLTNNAVDEDNPSWGAFFSSTSRTAFDFDQDGRADIGIYRPGAGEWWINRSLTRTTLALQFGAPGDTPTPGDFTGDGKTDIAFWRPSTGFWYVLRSENFTYYGFGFGTTGDIPAPGNFDGDTTTDPAVFRPSTGTWYELLIGSGFVNVVQFGVNGDKPVVGDYDGDGKADHAIYRPSNGQWWIGRTGSPGGRAVAFGNASDKPVPGDYTGDGWADVAFWRPSTGEWFILRSGDQSYYSIPFGINGDVPAPADYDGDGRFDPSVFRPSTSIWYRLGSTSGPVITGFGLPTDVPVASAYVR